MASRWLVKQEPSAYAFAQLVADGRTTWDGVRNSQARNALREMGRGDLVLYYHSGDDKAIVGVAKVAGEARPDPTAGPGDHGWLAVDLAPVKPLTQPVTLAQVKADATLGAMALVRQSRLSVMPVSDAEFRRVLQLAKTKL